MEALDDIKLLNHTHYTAAPSLEWTQRSEISNDLLPFIPRYSNIFIFPRSVLSISGRGISFRPQQ